MRILLSLLFSFMALPAAAHPHIFIKTGVTAIVDPEGYLTHLRIIWEYDELYSLLMTEELELDTDYDGILTDAETETLTGFDMKWIEGFNGDLVVRAKGKPIALSGPMEPTATLEDGKIITSHLRALTTPLQMVGSVVSVRPFDATFYTAYEVSKPVEIAGLETCEVVLIEPEMTDALSEIRGVLAGLPVDQDPADIGMADAGEKFATEIRVSCPAR